MIFILDTWLQNLPQDLYELRTALLNDQREGRDPGQSYQGSSTGRRAYKCADRKAVFAQRGAGLRLLGFVRSMPADEAALLAGVGQRLESTLKRLEQRAAVQKDPCLATAHRAFALFVHDLRPHGSGVFRTTRFCALRGVRGPIAHPGTEARARPYMLVRKKIAETTAGQ